MAQSQIKVAPFKNGFAVFRDDEVITRTETEEAALEYAERLKKGTQSIRPDEGS